MTITFAAPPNRNGFLLIQPASLVFVIVVALFKTTPLWGISNILYKFRDTPPEVGVVMFTKGKLLGVSITIGRFAIGAF